MIFESEYVAIYLHLGLQFILKDAVELLDVMLKKRVKRLPPERLGQLRSTYPGVRHKRSGV